MCSRAGAAGLALSAVPLLGAARPRLRGRPAPMRNGGRCSAPRPMPCCARRPPSGRSPARSSTSTARAPSPAPAARCRSSPRHQVRQRHRLAELLAAARQCRRHRDRHDLRHAPHRGALPPLRRPSRPRLRRRAAADRAALLHERPRARLRAGRRLTQASERPHDQGIPSPRRSSSPPCGAAAAWQALPSPPRRASPSPPPALDAPAQGGDRDRRARRRLLLGGAGRVPARGRGEERRLGLCRRRGGDGAATGWWASGRTGHAEAVEVTFDPERDQLRRDPADLLLGGARPDPAQPPGAGLGHRSTARPSSRRTRPRRRSPAAYIAQLDEAGVFDAPIATTIEPGRAFYPAEDYHQDYLTLNPTAPYIVYNDLPKIANLKRLFPAVWRDDPVLVSEAALAEPAG